MDGSAESGRAGVTAAEVDAVATLLAMQAYEHGLREMGHQPRWRAEIVWKWLPDEDRERHRSFARDLLSVSASARPSDEPGADVAQDIHEARCQVAAAYAEADAERRRGDVAERERDAARVENERLVGLLRKAATNSTWCPDCGCAMGHAPDCALAAALAPPQPSGAEASIPLSRAPNGSSDISASRTLLQPSESENQAEPGEVRGHPGDAHLPRGEKVDQAVEGKFPATHPDAALGIPISEQYQALEADPDKPSRTQSDLRETLALYRDQPDSYAATVRLGLLRAFQQEHDRHG